MNSTQKYLARFAEPLSAQAENLDAPAFQHCIVIPCFDEQPDFATALMQSPLWHQNVLVIVVVNQPAADAGTIDGESNAYATIHPNNQKLLAFFEQFPLKAKRPNLGLYQPKGHSSAWLVIDACSEYAPRPKQGVGLARKIGSDIAVMLWLRSKIRSPWLHSSDADTRLPHNYFDLPDPAQPNSEQHSNSSAYSGACYRFKHIQGGASEGVFEATCLYESAIKYYAQSLRWAGSPYGHTALGSAIATTFESYCAVRGFPKKSGGEDFYLLNKLAKVGTIYPAQQPIEIQTRTSHRVPFGTGPATQSIVELIHDGKPYCYYSPECFIALKQWLDYAPKLWPTNANSENLLSPLASPISNALQSIGVGELIRHLNRQVKTEKQATKTISDWFDAFKTLKFIHHLQAHQYPAQSLTLCLEQAVYKS